MTALKDVRIVELTAVITGPLAGQMLADLGADVIKVENPDGGDMFRNWRGGLYSSQFLAYNRNKRSVTLNLRSDEGKEVFLRLVETDTSNVQVGLNRYGLKQFDNFVQTK